MKLEKWHALVFRCPTCGVESEYALEIADGPHKGTSWNPAYWCEKCNTAARARDPWLFGVVLGPLVAMVAAMAFDALPHDLFAPLWLRAAFAAVCCGIAGWPLSRCLSRHLLSWEPHEAAAHSCHGRERR